MGTAATGWVFGGLGSSTDPYLTAGVVSGDTDGNGWLRLTNNTNNQATYALLDSEIFSVGAQIQIEMEYAFWNDGVSNATSGADGITFFLVDGSVDSATFQPGSYGGSLGYAALDTDGNGSVDSPGMAGAYLGFGFDNFGNYAGETEGRDGGIGTNYAGYANRISVRGPDDGDGNNATGWEFIQASSPLQNLSGGGQMDFPNNTTRPGQTGADYRAFRLTLDADNQLVVEMKFGASADYIVAFTADLSAYESDRPDTFKIGFTGSTGGSKEIHEIRNVSVVSTPGATIGGSFEWDDGKNSSDDNWGSGNPTNEANDNWFSFSATNNNKTPFIDSDIFFGSRPAETSAGADARPSPYASVQNVNLDNDVRVKSLNINTKYDYVLGSTTGKTITLGNTAVTGTPSINVTDSIANPRFHNINNNLIVAENLEVANQSHSALSLNGTMSLGANTLTTVGPGYTNFNGVITGSGPIIATGAAPNARDSTGIVTLNANNGTSYTGAITVNGGQLVALHNNALGTTATGTTVNSGGTLTFRGGITTSEPLTLSGTGTALSEIWNAGALYNDGGDNTLNGTVTLAGDTTLRSRAGNLTLAGQLQQNAGSNRSLTKTGDGTLTLTGTNSLYNNRITAAGGALRFGAAASFTTATNYALDGGVFEFGADLNGAGAADLQINLGSGNNAIQWIGDGGFSAHGANRSIQLNYNTAAVTWGSGGFVGTGNALVLGSTGATHTFDFQNAIDLGSAQREIRVIDGSSNTTGAVDGLLSGALAGTGGINKTGSGTLELSANNTYTGTTQISGGALRVSDANRIDGSNLTLSGGVLELSGDLDTGNTGDFTRSLGTGTSAVQWAGDGGFAASGAARSVRLGNGTSQVTWGGTSFVGTSNALVFGSTSADNTVTLGNALALGSSGTRTIRTVQGTSTTVASGALSGVVSGSAGLAVTGNGRLDLTANNTYTGATTVSGGELRVSGSNGDIAQSSALTVGEGGTLVLDNTSAANTDRIGDSASIALSGGTLNFTSSTYITEDIGALTLKSGTANTIIVGDGTANSGLMLQANGLTRETGSTLLFLRDDSSTDLKLDAAPTGISAAEQGIFAYAVAGNGTSPTGFLQRDSGSAEATPNNGANTTQGSWASSTIANTTADQQLDADRTVGALILGNGIDVTQTGSRTLTVQTGGILSTGTTGSLISATNLQVGGSNNRELITHVYGTGGLEISSVIRNNSNTTGLTKSGDGTLTLSGSGSNTYSGTTTVNAGTLALNKSGGATAIAGNLTVGDGAGTDTVKILADEQINDNSTVTLRGGTVGNRADNQAVLDLGDSLETFQQLTVTGNSVIDFSGGSPSAPSFLVINVLDIATDAILTVRNWIDAADYFLVKKTGLDTTIEQEHINRIVFEGYGTAVWEDYSSDYFMITPYAAPVPEPAAFGLLACGGLTAFAALRRRRRAPRTAARNR